MTKWVWVLLLGALAHFGASYLVPLEVRDQGALGGLLRWVWPWGMGDSGLLGRISPGHMPLVGFWIAMAAAVMSAMALLAVLGIWVPIGWWRGLAMGGAILVLVLMVGFLGPTKTLPILTAVVVLAGASIWWRSLAVT